MVQRFKVQDHILPLIFPYSGSIPFPSLIFHYRIMFKKLASKQCIRSLSLHRLMSTSMSRQSKLTTLSVDDKTGIATLEMNRPPVNSLNTLLLKDISNALDEVAKNRSKGLILTSVKISIFYFFFLWKLNVCKMIVNYFQSSATVFSAGLDIMEMYKPDPEKVKLFWTTVQEVWLKLYGSAFPTAAAINVRLLSNVIIEISNLTQISLTIPNRVIPRLEAVCLHCAVNTVSCARI